MTERTGNAASGRQAFAGHCASCHAVDGSGAHVDRSERHTQSPADAILLHLLVPDYKISPGYQAYAVETRGRQTLVRRQIGSAQQ
jgi:mono/diheme cytochrome c family protein